MSHNCRNYLHLAKLCLCWSMRQIITVVDSLKKPHIIHLGLKQKHILIIFLCFLKKLKLQNCHYKGPNSDFYACEAIYLLGPSIPNLKKDIFKNSFSGSLGKGACYQACYVCGAESTTCEKYSTKWEFHIQGSAPEAWWQAP